MNQNDLPTGWSFYKFEDIVDESHRYPIGDGDHGQIKPSWYQNSGVPYIRVADIVNNRIETDKMVYISEQVHNDNPKSHLFPDDIIIAKTGATIGKVAIIPKWMKTANTTSSVGKISVNKKLVNPKYVYFFIQSASFKSKMWSVSIKSAQPGFNIKDLKKFTIPLPSLEMQEKIIQKLDYVFAQLGEKNKAILELKHFLKIQKIGTLTTQSILDEAFSGRLSEQWRKDNSSLEPVNEILKKISKERQIEYKNQCVDATKEGRKKPKKPINLVIVPKIDEFPLDIPKTWACVTLRDIASIKPHAMSSGPFGSALGTKDYRKYGVPVIRGQNIQNGKFLLKNFVYVSEDKAMELKRSFAYPGDIVSVAVGSSGSSAIVPNELQVAILSQNCNKITLDEKAVISEYVNYFLQLEAGKNQLKEKTTDTARPFLSLTNLKETLIPLPPLQEQKIILEIMDQKIHQINNIERKIISVLNLQDNMLMYLDRIPSQILGKAFAGKLIN